MSIDMQALIQQLEADDPVTRMDAIKALGQNRVYQAVEPLMQRLDDPHDDVKIAAINALRLIRDERVSVPFIWLLNDENVVVRRSVSAWFMTLSGDQAHLVDPLCEIMLAPESRMSTREFAAMLLGKFGDERAIEPLHQIIQMDATALKMRVAQSLRRMSHPDSVPVLAPLLEDEYEERLQKVAAKTLKAIGTEDAQAALLAWHQRQLE